MTEFFKLIGSRLSFAALGLVFVTLASCGEVAVEAPPSENLPKLVKVPSEIPKSFGNGRAKLYDDCADQKVLFEEASLLAKQEGKTLIISYGAEWCIWRHVFDKYVQGYSDTFTYTYGEPSDPQAWTDTLREKAEHDAASEALEFTTYFRENFVLFHLESDNAPNGDAVLTQTSASTYYDNWLPFIFTVDEAGRYFGHIDYEEVQIRRDTMDWYRGYDRQKLTTALKKIDPRRTNSE